MKDGQLRTGYLIHDHQKNYLGEPVALKTLDRDKAERAYLEGKTVEVGPMMLYESYRYGNSLRVWNYPQQWKTYRKKEKAQ